MTEEYSKVGKLPLDATSERDDVEDVAADGNAASKAERSNARSGFEVLNGSLPATGIEV